MIITVREEDRENAIECCTDSCLIANAIKRETGRVVDVFCNSAKFTGDIIEYDLDQAGRTLRNAFDEGLPFELPQTIELIPMD